MRDVDAEHEPLATGQRAPSGELRAGALEHAPAEREARMAQKNAERQRAEAELHEERAQMHERGDADHELIEDHERERFAGTSADRDGSLSKEPRSEFDQGREVGHEEEAREHDARFNRDGRTDDARTEQPGSRRA